jgi:hypothetical protein
MLSAKGCIKNIKGARKMESSNSKPSPEELCKFEIAQVRNLAGELDERLVAIEDKIRPGGPGSWATLQELISIKITLIRLLYGC